MIPIKFYIACLAAQGAQSHEAIKTKRHNAHAVYPLFIGPCEMWK